MGEGRGVQKSWGKQKEKKGIDTRTHQFHYEEQWELLEGRRKLYWTGICHMKEKGIQGEGGKKKKWDQRGITDQRRLVILSVIWLGDCN